MAKRYGEMTEQERNLYEIIKKAGEQGLNIDEMIVDMGIARASIYRHLKVLVDYGRVTPLVRKRNGYKVYAADRHSIMHILPGAGASMPALPVAEYLNEWLRVKDVNSTGTIKAFKRFPFYLSSLCQFAIRWNTGERDQMPYRDEQNQLREALLDVSVRGKLIHEMAQSLLDNEDLWKSQKAYHAWFGDPRNVFKVEDAKRIHEHLMEVCSK